MIVRGLVIPFGVPGVLTVGGHRLRLEFKPGAVTWPEDVSRVKLLVEHDQAGLVLGHATSIGETDRGLAAAFEVDPERQEFVGKQLGRKLRDGLSPGVDLSPATQIRARRAQGTTHGDGTLREVSLVCVPAWAESVAVTG